MSTITSATTALEVKEGNSFTLTLVGSDVDTSGLTVSVFAYLPGDTMASQIIGTASGATAGVSIAVTCTITKATYPPGIYILEAIADYLAAGTGPHTLLMDYVLGGETDAYLGLDGVSDIALHIHPSGPVA